MPKRRQDGGALIRIARELRREVAALRFRPPVTCVYNPLEYAWEPHRQYLSRFGSPPKEIVLIGMNPGPWGMVQTGVPFGNVGMVRDWMGIEARVGKPHRLHPKRPVDGFTCRRSEVSGARLWGWARDRHGTSRAFFRRFFVINYCPLCFFEADGRNRTPDRLPAGEREKLFQVCDRALARTIDALRPRVVLGIGRFAGQRAGAVLEDRDLIIDSVPHPSPANPGANRGWASKITGVVSKFLH